MAKQQILAAPSRHWLRHIRQVPEGTPGAVQDAILESWWLAETKGLTFVQAQDTLTLGDESQLDLTLPSLDQTGRSAGDRFYFLAGSPDITPAAAAGAVAPYHPGDEFFELYQDRSNLVMTATPYDAQPTVGQVLFNSGDAFRLLRKARETTAGWWCNAPRDAFEHYTRLWKAVVSEDFADAAAQLPPTVDILTTTGTTPDGLWDYDNVTSAGGAGHATFPGPAGTLTSTVGVFDAGVADHSCWRAEANFSTVWTPSGTVPFLYLRMVDSTGEEIVALSVSPTAGIVIQTTVPAGDPVSWPVDTSTLFPNGTAAAITAPYTLAIEARDRFIYFYVDGQFVGNAPRVDVSAGLTLYPEIAAAGLTSIDFALADYVVLRKTSPALNGGAPGDYFLPSPPSPGGLTGEYFDLASFMAQYGDGGGPGPGGSVPLFGAPIVNAFKLGERQDASLAFGQTDTQPAWQIPCTYQFGVRWSGAIYLPLDEQDVHFALPTTGVHGTLDQMRLWVGRTRAGEQILTNWAGDTPVSSSVGMRSLFGEIPGWYPLVFEWNFLGSGGGVDYTTNPEITWDVGGAGSTIPSSRLAPLGCFRQQVKNDSHYDTLQTTLAQAFAYQFTCEPRQLESGFFPGAIIPRARVGRDTDMVLDDTIGIDPQPQLVGEDIADAVLADAQGLGGSSSGDLTLEAFNFAGLLQHPFVSSELESVPQTTVAAQLVTTLLTLVGFREAIWEQLQSAVAPVRQKQDTFPLTGELAEFDWKPGDGLRVRLPAVFVEDQLPRQLYTVQRTRTPDGVSDAQATFQPRIRSPQNTLRKFIRQVYGASRTFQGQLVTTESGHVDAPDQIAVSLPVNVANVRKAELVVVAGAGDATIFVNGADTGIPATVPGSYSITQQVAKNAGVEPRMLVNLPAPSAGAVTYCVRLTVLIPSF